MGEERADRVGAPVRRWFGQLGHALTHGISVARARARAAGYGKPLSDMAQVILIITAMCREGPSALQLAFRRTIPFGRRPLGISEPHVFPLPMPEQSQKQAGAEEEFVRSNVALLNLMYAGRVPDHVPGPPTATQRRLVDMIRSDVSHFVSRGLPVAVTEELDECCLTTDGYAGSSTVVEELDERGGIPAVASQVDTGKILDTFDPVLALQVLEPRKVLLPSRSRPLKLQKAYSSLGKGYGVLMKKARRAGLVQFRAPRQVAEHRGKHLVSGNFAVRESDQETRVITDVAVNQLMNEELVPRPAFAYIPRMRSYTVPANCRLLVNKVDARHYFHMLAIGSKWKKYLAHNPVMTRRGLRYPVHCAIPMGFKPACGMAQAVTDATAVAASLPQDRRVIPTAPTPLFGSVWGSTVDDIWALDPVVEATEKEPDGSQWMRRCVEAWDGFGIAAHPDKVVIGAAGSEVQGYYFDPRRHTVGVALDKRWLVM